MSKVMEFCRKLKDESRNHLDDYLGKFLRPHQYMIDETKNGFLVKMTSTPRGSFIPQNVVHSYFRVDLQKVKSL